MLVLTFAPCASGVFLSTGANSPLAHLVAVTIIMIIKPLAQYIARGDCRALAQYRKRFGNVTFIEEVGRVKSLLPHPKTAKRAIANRGRWESLVHSSRFGEGTSL